MPNNQISALILPLITKIMQAIKHRKPKSALILLVLAFAFPIFLLLAGCRAPAPPPSPASSPTLAAAETQAATPSLPTATASPHPTATSTATDSPTVTPSPSPTGTSTPTPTPAVPISLAQARQWMKKGDYAAAIADFNDFLKAHPDHPLAARARFELAQSWLAAGNPEQAIPILQALAQDDEVIARYPEILYWLGRAYEPGNKQKAAAAFLNYADHSHYLKADAILAAADAYLADQDVMAALDAYFRALDAASDIVTRLRAREGLAQAFLQDAQPGGAIEQYDAILEDAKSPAYRAEILYRLGMAYQASGLSMLQEEAWKNFRDAIAADKTSWYAYQALIQLVDAEQPVDPRLRAEVDIHAGAYFPAIAILTQLLAENPENAGELQALLAQAYEGVENYSAAAEAWRQALAASPDATTQNQAWLGLGRSLWRQGRQEDARQVYLQAATQAADPDTAATALWWAAVLAGQDNAKWLQAADDFMRLARHFPHSDYADQAGFRAGLIHYRLGDAEAARELWTEHAAAGDSSWQAAAHYWLGKLLRQTGHEEESLSQWRETARRWGDDNFYGVRARQQLQEAGATPPTPAPASQQEQGLEAAMIWAADLAGRDITAFQQTPPEFGRIDELHRVGEDARGHRELEALRRAWQDDPVKLLQTALFARDLGYYDSAIRAASQLVTYSEQPLTAAPRAVQELIYPLYYRDLMLDSARAFDLDPALYYALIRQESLFWAPATSLAGATGLAQIMPATGESAARQLAMEDFALSDLLRPHISLYLGAYILSEELRRSDGNVFRSLAAYNAGPGNAAFWWELAEGDSDLFVELISFRETQHYVRTIITQAHHYRRLYPDLTSK